MVREWLQNRLFALECGNGRRLRRGGFGVQLVLGRIGIEILILKFELRKQPDWLPVCEGMLLGS